MKMKGFRVVPLTGEREIPREIGEVHHLTLSFERAEWWSKRLGNEDPSWVPLAYQYTAYGFAIMEVEAEECIPDTKSNPELDFLRKDSFRKADYTSKPWAMDATATMVGKN